MQRLAPVLIALLAAVALVTAGGSFESAGGPSLDGGDSPDSGPTPQEDPAAGGNRGHGPTAPGDAAADGGGSTTPASSGGGGLSWLISVLVVGSIGVGLVLIVLLTRDDERVPDRTEDESDGAPRSTGPRVDPEYASPDDNAVVRAWRRLATRVDDVGRSASPAETAAAARDRGFPADAVVEITRQFRAVRYGRERATPERERRADRMAERVAGTETEDAISDPDDVDAVEEDYEEESREADSVENGDPSGDDPGGERR